MEFLTASTLKSPHGFPTRAGGVSKGAFRALNTSLVVGDDPHSVEQNLGFLAAAAGASVVSVTQVHSDRVVWADTCSADTQADAVVTSRLGSVVGVRTADCLPILVENRATGSVAAVHAGWRGVEKEIVVRAIEALAPRELSSIFVAIGPCIQRCCFEVDGDLPSRFVRAFGPQVLLEERRVDLPASVQVSLARLGVPASQVAVLPQCTMCDSRFFSHRRDRGVTGRHLSFIRCGSTAL